MRGVSESWKEGNDTEWDAETDTILIPFLFVSQSLNEEAFVGFNFFVGPFLERVSSSCSFVRVVNGLIFGAWIKKRSTSRDEDNVWITFESISLIKLSVNGGIDFGDFSNTFHFSGELCPFRSEGFAVSTPWCIEF